jgi:hypothetical protein
LTYVHGFHGNGGHFENSKTWLHLLRWVSTFLWSLVKIGSSVSENLVGQVHGEKKKRNNNNTQCNNNKKRCKNNNSLGLNNNKKRCNTISLQTSFGNLIRNRANTICLPKLRFQFAMAAILNQKWSPKYKNSPIWAKFGFQVDYNVANWYPSLGSHIISYLVVFAPFLIISPKRSFGRHIVFALFLIKFPNEVWRLIVLHRFLLLLSPKELAMWCSMYYSM